jgi:uncharacterized protein YcbK (DUF882 family)
MIDWSDYPNFTEKEFACSCGCGRADMDPELLSKLQALRTLYGKPMSVTSGFRCSKHPNEASKIKPGSHAQGKAVDIRTRGGGQKYELKKLAYSMGFVGIGDGDTFTHLDVGHDHAARPANWRY